MDLSQVSGQEAAKRALEIAATGSHNVVFVGPPNADKTALLQCLPGILPGPVRSLRAPHSSTGVTAMHAEISQAAGGVLLLVDLPTFRPEQLSMVRHYLRFSHSPPMVAATMNHCPCGYFGDPWYDCACTPDELERYRARARPAAHGLFGLQVEIAPSYDAAGRRGESSAEVRATVAAGRAFRDARHARITPGDPDGLALEGQGKRLLDAARERLGLPAPAIAALLRVARTIADLAGSEKIGASHVAEAVQYRALDRQVSTP